MTKKFFLAILLIQLILTTSCMSTKLIANYDSDNVIHHKETRITYLWGIIQPKDVPAECESKTICQVQAKTNAGFIIISFVTLGIVVPQTVQWDCCAKDVKEEIID